MSSEALVATRKGLFKIIKDNTSWSLQPVEFAGVPVTMVLTLNQTWYAALNHGQFGVKLHRSDNAGKTWIEVAAPVYPKLDDGVDGDSLELIWSMEFAAADNDKALWAGTIPGGLFYSEDGGESWTLNNDLWQHKQEQKWFGGGFDQAGIHSICIHPENKQHITVGVSCAGVWQSTNGGGSWHPRSQGLRAEYLPPEQQYDSIGQDPHRLVHCLSDAEHMWMQHHNGIFVSDDGANSWQEIEDIKPSVFGFATVVHPQDGNTAWFVPGVKDECRIPVDAKFVVNRTRDGGKSFQALSKGLPDVASYDLVYRHGLDISASGDCLLMGSTTGNLWISENMGDEWQCISNYLPPIACVRFIK